MEALQSAHNFSRVIIESGAHYLVHVYNSVKVNSEIA